MGEIFHGQRGVVLSSWEKVLTASGQLLSRRVLLVVDAARGEVLPTE